MLIQQMRQHYVTDTEKITQSEFDQIFTLIKAMPGPIAFQMAVYLGNRFHKIAGGGLAGLGLLLPSFVMIVLIGFFYSSLVGLSFVNPVLDGFLFSASAVILMSLKSLVATNYRFILFIPLVLVNIYLSWHRLVPEPLLIIGFGVLSVLLNQNVSRLQLFSVAFLFVDWQKIIELFKICLISGAVVFGTGLALIPVLKTDLVDLHQWITIKEFNDGVIFGQMTPGPVTITSAFFGYQISGLVGALVAMLGVFFMPFVHMVTWFPYAVKALSKQKWIADFLVGATSAVLGCILTTLTIMNINSYNRIMFWVLFIATLAVLILKPKTSIVLLIVGAGLLNLIVSLVI